MSELAPHPGNAMAHPSDPSRDRRGLRLVSDDYLAAQEEAPDISTDGSRSAGQFAVAIAEVHLVTGLIRIRLCGELDIQTGPALHSGIDRLVGPWRAPVGGLIVLDLSDLTFLDLSGEAALRQSRSSLAERQWRVVLVRALPNVARVIAFAETAASRT